ncbi:MAG: GspH/FimT family protein [Thermodesulfovibrionales bacterium]|nr:GspH/FimT family protein [Thermodesulfovibrionales bacterium]
MKLKNQKGISLVEVMIVIAIIAILAGIAVPSFQRHAINADLKGAARELAGDFFYCRERAISDNQQYTITINTGANSYTVNCPPTESKTRVISDQRRGNIRFSSTTVTQYDFRTRGTVTNGTIVFINDLGSTATIRINITGRTNVEFNLQ